MSQDAGEGVRRNVQGVRTRDEILRAAGKLFATMGFGQTSIRDLAKESGAGLSTIIYHFRSKDNLYLETIRHFALDMVRVNSLFEPLFTVDTGNKQAVADVLLATIYSFLSACHGPQKVEHLIGLYNRLLVEGNEEALKMLMDCFADVESRLPEFFRKVEPGLTDVQIVFMQQLLWSLLQYTVAGKRLILYKMSGVTDYPEEYIAAAAWHFTSYCCLPLGLPSPRWPAEQ